MSGNDSAADVRTLVVDDEREVAEAYALRLRGYCDIETAYSGDAALSVVDDAVYVASRVPCTTGSMNAVSQFSRNRSATTVTINGSGVQIDGRLHVKETIKAEGDIQGAKVGPVGPASAAIVSGPGGTGSDQVPARVPGT